MSQYLCHACCRQFETWEGLKAHLEERHGQQDKFNGPMMPLPGTTLEPSDVSRIITGYDPTTTTVEEKK